MPFAISSIPLKETGYFDSLFLDYVSQSDRLSDFYSFPPNLEGIIRQTKIQELEAKKRALLHSVLIEQYREINSSEATSKNIQALLDSNTYSITTGHQLCLFTGPLYFILKIVSVVRYVEELNKKQSQYRYVPVYWMASEDHDSEEINQAFLFNKKLIWDSEQSGKVGEFKTHGIDAVVKEVMQLLGENETSTVITSLLKQAYRSDFNLAQATRFLVNELFGKYGLIIIDADDKKLKASFKTIIESELKDSVSFTEVSKTSQSLKDIGYKTQVNPRTINFFYCLPGARERIEKKDIGFQVLNSSISFTEEELWSELNQHPERFSPNVITRPLYQQFILPNVAYVGGPGEIAYWLQYKSMFEAFQIPFPVLLPRLFLMVIEQGPMQKIEKLGLTFSELFDTAEDLIKLFIAKNNLALSLDEEKKELEDIFSAVSQKLLLTDTTLKASVEAEWQKALKGIENLEQKANKAIKTKNEQQVTQIKSLKEKLFPDDQLQERKENVFSFISKHPDFIKTIYEATSNLPETNGELKVMYERN